MRHSLYKLSPFGLIGLALCGLVLYGAGCTGDLDENAADSEPPLFQRLPTDVTGVTFSNTLAESPDLNILNYLYYYNGGGVAVGDVNGDDLPDLYFTANEAPNRLYLNRGNLTFEDVTDAAGVAGTADWTTGVTMADVNGDGRLDLYVSAVDGYQGLSGGNALYINQGTTEGGVPTFTEEAAARGLDFAGFGTQAAFFDYDRDGDLDVYLLNHSVHDEHTYGRTSLRQRHDPQAGDRLLRNDEGRFVDVTDEAGIISGSVGYGLGVAVSDLDTDGCPDLYISNDFHENDYLYYNNCDGTFTESVTASMEHTSRFSMGNDAADINNDGRPDLAVLDMLPQREDILKTSVATEGHNVYQLKLDYGYHHQYARNTLQLNQGMRRFSDIGYLAGVQATDWSWAPLLADLDNDGRKDLFVANGIYRRPNDLDYINYVSNAHIQAALRRGITEKNLELLSRMPQIAIPNYVFRNTGDLRFENQADAWGLTHEGFSNGAAYADLDNDGDLDLVTNNINEPASIYENRADSLSNHRYLALTLEGDGANTAGIGTKVLLRTGDTTQMQELVPTRGYQSSVDPRLHFGLGLHDTVDALTVVWPDGRYQELTDVAANQRLVLHQRDASGSYPYPDDTAPDPLFADVTGDVGLNYEHQENSFTDFDRERLMPHRLSTEGPALAVGDVNGDGLDDLYAGGARNQPGRLLIQQPGGAFTTAEADLWETDAAHEDVDATFFDADQDDDLDLYVVSGGNEFGGDTDILRDRLYLNDGTGRFRRADDALPRFYANGACVAPADYDGDGDTDLFVGSRAVAGAYGRTPQSYLLENDGDGRFTDTTDYAENLAQAGMVTSAAWTDYDQNGRLDLVVAGEWMPVRVFAQQPDGRFTERTADVGLAQTHGWWTALHTVDADGDGDDDLVAGNLGLNSKLHASPDEPVRLYINDFDGNGSLDPVLTYYRDGTSYPMASRDELLAQIEPLKKQFPTYADFGAREVDEFLPDDRLDEAEVKHTYLLTSTVFINEGGTFAARSLPVRAQMTPVHAIRSGDIDHDGHMDLVLGGNFYGTKPSEGRYDAGYGTFLRGDGTGRFEAVPPAKSSLLLTGEVRALRWLTWDSAPVLVAARNNAPLQVIRINAPATAGLSQP